MPAATGTAVSITFKGLSAYDHPASFTWPLPQDGPVPDCDKTPPEHSRTNVPAGATSSTPSRGEYVTYHRSPFSVLRSRHCRVNRCAAGVLASSFDTSTQPNPSSSDTPRCAVPYCCCSALLYPVFSAPSASSAASSASADTAERLRDDFLWALKLAGVGELLRSTLGPCLYARFMTKLGITQPVAAVLTCSDPIATARRLFDAAAGASTAAAAPPPSAYVARLLLTADEDIRIKWLQEESRSMEPGDYYSRAPSLRALFVMRTMLPHEDQRTRGATAAGPERDRNADAGHASPPDIPCPTTEQIRRVLLRMEERNVELSMADIAALAAIGEGTTGELGIPDGEFWEGIARQLKTRELEMLLLRKPSSTPSAAHDAAQLESLELRHVLLLSLLLRYVTLAGSVKARGAADTTTFSTLSSADDKLLLPMTWFDAASEVIQLLKCLRGAPGLREEGGQGSSLASSLRDTLVALSDAVLTHACCLVAEARVSVSSPHLPELTTWLLREMVTSPVCELHFKRLVDRSLTEALVAVEKSGLLNRSTIDLKVVVRQLIPLLESCGSEDLYTSVLRDVLSALEEKGRRDGFAFSVHELRYLSELGTKLFTNGSGESGSGGYGVFDEFARGQMEELHVMDGSPWALCVSSYRSLKEMLQGIVRDQRRLKAQVQEQLRSLSNAASFSAALSATDSDTTPSATGNERGRGRAASASAPSSSQSTSPSLEKEGEMAGDGATGHGTSAQPGVSPAAKQGASNNVTDAPPPPPRIPVPPMLRERFLVLVEEIVRAQVDESSGQSDRSMVVSNELFSFVTKHVPVPNIHDEYRRKLFLLVNVAEDSDAARCRTALRKQARQRHLRKGTEPNWSGATQPHGDDDDDEDDPHGGAHEIPAELRFLVSSLPLTLSPWASVMILREVLAESAGQNPRYTYVLNAAIDLQLPISTTRSRIATTLNMWRFLNSQAHKLSLKESVVMKQRCAWNLPLAYILSSYWSLLTWLALASIVTLNVVGIDWESQIVANSLFRMFAPWEEIGAAATDGEDNEEAEPWTTQAAADLAADYFEQAEIADRRREEHRRSSASVFLSSASYLFLGYDDQRRPMTVVPIGSASSESTTARAAEEYAAATAVLRELSLHAPFPFFVDFERALPIELVQTRIAERIRRVSFNNTWFLPRMIIRTFPLGRRYTEEKLILHTCTQANLTRRRVTFLMYMHSGVAVTPQFIEALNASFLSKNANLVLVVHESSLLKGGSTPAALARISRHDAAKRRASSEADAASPSDLRDAGHVTEDRPVRVLPLCRQLCATNRSSGLGGVKQMNGGRGAAGEASWIAGIAQRLWGAPPVRLPLFASQFSDQRTFQHQSHCERQEAAVSDRRGFRLSAPTEAGRQAQAWWHPLSATAAATALLLNRIMPIGKRKEEEISEDAAQDEDGRKKREMPSSSRDVVRVSFTAMRRLMEEVSAPVPVTSRQQQDSGSGSTRQNFWSRFTKAASPTPAPGDGSTQQRPSSDTSTAAPPTPAPGDGSTRQHFWSRFTKAASPTPAPGDGSTQQRPSSDTSTAAPPTPAPDGSAATSWIKASGESAPMQHRPAAVLTAETHSDLIREGWGSCKRVWQRAHASFDRVLHPTRTSD